MLTHLRIQNFKSWQDTGDIRLAPITVFFGSNSSGKTSLSQFLLLLQQTAQSPDRHRVLHPGDSQTPVDLGTFHDMVFDHDENREIGFELRWELPESLEVEDPRTRSTYRGSALEFQAGLQAIGGDETRVVVDRLSYRLGDPADRGLSVGLKRDRASRGIYELDSSGLKLLQTPGRAGRLPAPIRFYGFPDEAVAYYQNAAFLSDLTLALERQLRRIYYLGPLREPPRRHYTWAGVTPEHVGWRGERAVEALLAARERKLSPGPKKRSLPFEKLIAQHLLDLELIEEFAARRLAPGRKEYEVLVRTRGGRRQPVNLTDVGFGVSQILPVVVECFYAPHDSTIILEQPEIHLHPRVQASLADFFIEVIRSREGGRDRRIQLIVESHSEHFLRRLQRRIAEERIRPEDAALYFVESGPRGASVIQPLDLDEFGNIANWPADFFGDEIGDLAAMTQAALRRKMKQPAKR